MKKVAYTSLFGIIYWCFKNDINISEGIFNKHLYSIEDHSANCEYFFCSD